MTKQLRIKLVSVESGITAIGFRKIAAVTRSIEPLTEICFVAIDNLYSFTSALFLGKDNYLKDGDIELIAEYLAKSDIVAFSSMTASAEYVQNISKNIKKINPDTFLLWGGVHPTLYPEESIEFVDAICIGDGETPVKMFIEGLQKGTSLTDVPNMWFYKNGNIIKNAALPLNSPEFLNLLPHSYNNNDCLIFDSKRKSFRQFNKFDYTNFNGLLFRTIWTLGCPYNCSYCANDSFIKLDPGYRKLRYPSVDYMIEEIKLARVNYPYISTVAFYDDNFIALPLHVLKEFCEKYKKRVNLPFVVFGMHPNLITKEKVELLAEAGMNRARMGIQAGSEATLKFFERPTAINKILESAAVLADAAKKYQMIPPAYDVISDNPNETREDVAQTLELIFKLKWPFTLNIFSLRVFPKTKLYDYVQEHPQLLEYFRDTSYLDTKTTINNVMLYLLTVDRIPKFIFEKLMSMLKKEDGLTKEHPVLFVIVKFLYLVRRAIPHLIKLDFSTIVGSWTYYIWKISAFWRKKHTA
ncbi:MAG: radical SAM protein [Syntrophales bacterium]|nr:radical SAM protein [Syntrophales bacterium]